MKQAPIFKTTSQPFALMQNCSMRADAAFKPIDSHDLANRPSSYARWSGTLCLSLGWSGICRLDLFFIICIDIDSGTMGGGKTAGGGAGCTYLI